MAQPFQFRPRSTSKSPRPPHSNPSAELKPSSSSEGGYASTSANGGGDFRVQGYNGAMGGAGRMPYPMNGMNNGYGPAGGAAGPGGGGGGYYYPQYPASGAYDGVNGSQEGMHYAAVQGGYDYSNGTTNGGQAGPSRYPYNPYYPPYYAPQYPTISGQLPTANQNPYLTPSPYPVYHSQYAPQHYPQHQQGYYYPPPYQHGPGPGGGNPYAQHPQQNGYHPFIPQGYVPPSPAISNHVPHHRGQSVSASVSASASGGGSISGSSVQPSQRAGTPVRVITPTPTTTVLGGQPNGMRPTVSSPSLVATQLATPSSPSLSAVLQSPTILPDTSLPLTYISPSHSSGVLPRSMSFGEIEVDTTTTAGMGVGAVVMKSPGGGAGSGVVYESVMKKARERKEEEKKVAREDSGVEVESVEVGPVEVGKGVEDEVLKEGQMGMGSVAVVGGDFMLAPGRPSLSSSTPTITFLLTSTTPSSVISTTKVYSGPHDGPPNGDVSKTSKKVKGKERRQDGRVEFERRLRRESGGEKLVFGTMEADAEDGVEKELAERYIIHSGKEEEQRESRKEEKQPVEDKKSQESITAQVATPSEPTTTSSIAAELPTIPPPAPSASAPSTPASQAPATKSVPKSWAALVRGPQAAATPSSAPSTTATPSGLASPASPATSSVPLLPIASSSTTASASSTAPVTPGNAPRVGGYAAAASIGAASFGGYAHPSALGAGRQAEDLGKLLLEGLNPAVANRSTRVASVPRGIINTGNMCFANSILQVLAYCTPFTNLFEELSKRVKADLGRRTPLMEAMFQFLQEFTSTPSQSTETSQTPPNGLQPSLMPQSPASSSRRELGVTSTGSRREPFVPTYVYDAMKENKRFDSMRRGHQEDAEEFLGFFLETLHEEMLYLHSRHISRLTQPSTSAVTNGHGQHRVDDDEAHEVDRPVSPVADDGWLEVGKKQKINVVRNTESKESAVSRIFGGKLRSVLHTPGQKDSITLEPYQPLQLDISPASVYTITDALHHLHEPEVIPGVFSTSRGINVDATKQVFVETLPPILILHFKRFLYDAVEQRVVKKGKAVGYGTELVVPGEIMSPGRKGEAGKYKLFGVIYHHGSSASGGHYTASVLSQSPHTRSPSSDTSVSLVPTTWVHLDDESIQHVPVDEVIVTRDQAVQGRNGEIGGKGRERCAYLCFYQRE